MRILTLLSFCLLLSAGTQAQQNRLFKKHTGKQSFKQNSLNKAEVKQLPQSTMEFFWENDSWSLTDSVVTTYNAKGLVASEEKTYLSGAQQKYDYLYDSTGKETARYTMVRDDKFFPWDSVAKSTTTYDQNGNESVVMDYSYQQGTGWVINYGYKSVYTYNTAKLPVTIEFQYYDEDLSTFVKSDKTTFDYDNTGKITAATSMTWNDVAYENDSKTAEIIWYKWNSTDFDASLMASSNDYDWNGTTYQLSSRSSSTYDSHDNETEYKEEEISGGTWSIEYGSKYTLTYNVDGAMTEKIEQGWNSDDTLWVNNYRYEYSNFLAYTDTSGNTGMLDLAGKSAGLTVYPNPFETQTVISLTESKGTAQFMLYNLTGKNVRTLEFVNGTVVLEKGDLPSGMYFYIVTDNQKTQSSGKLMIK